MEFLLNSILSLNIFILIFTFLNFLLAIGAIVLAVRTANLMIEFSEFWAENLQNAIEGIHEEKAKIPQRGLVPMDQVGTYDARFFGPETEIEEE